MDIIARSRLNKCAVKKLANDEAFALVATAQIKRNEPIAVDCGMLREGSVFAQLEGEYSINHLEAFTIPTSILEPLGYDGPDLVLESGTQGNETL